MYVLTTLSTHFSYMASDLWYYSDGEKGNPLPPLHRLLFSISSKGFFYKRIPTDRIVRTSVVEYCLENSPPKRIDPPTHSAVTDRYTTESYVSPDSAVAKSSVNGLVSTGFASQYRLQPRVGF